MPEFQIPSNVPNSLKIQVFDARKLLPTNPKYTWESLKGLRDLKNLTTIACHHDALDKATTASLGDLELAKRIANNHIRSKRNIPGGDPGFPYHIWIRNGVIYVCNSLEAFTYGVASNNSYTVHICVSGDYVNGDKMDERDRIALYAAILMVKSMVPSIVAIKGHKELSPTSCPGYDMEQVNNDIKAIEAHMSLGSELEETPNATMTQVYAAYTRFTDLYNVANKQGPNQAEAQRKIMQIADMMAQSGLLNQ